MKRGACDSASVKVWVGGFFREGGRGVRVKVRGRVNRDLVCYMMPMQNALTADGLTLQYMFDITTC